MRLQHVQQSRPDWYDRGGVSRVFGYFDHLIVPHADTVRWSYTVPSGKKMAVQVFEAAIGREVVAGVPGFAFASVAVTPSGGAEVKVLAGVLVGNVVGEGQALAAGSTMVLVAGDVVAGHSLDQSTGGSCYYFIGFEGLEFDA